MTEDSIDPIKIELLHKELKELELRSGIIGSAIIKQNGLLIISRLPRDIDHRKVGAMAATMFGAIETASTTLGDKNKVYSLTIEFEDFQLIIINAENKVLFATLIDLNVNLGLILIEIEDTIKNIIKIIGC